MAQGCRLQYRHRWKQPQAHSQITKAQPKARLKKPPKAGGVSRIFDLQLLYLDVSWRLFSGKLPAHLPGANPSGRFRPSADHGSSSMHPSAQERRWAAQSIVSWTLSPLCGAVGRSGVVLLAGVCRLALGRLTGLAGAGLLQIAIGGAFLLFFLPALFGVGAAD